MPERTSPRPELLVSLARGSREPLRQQIERAFRDAIRARRLTPGCAVPSTRTLAKDLRPSRGVVVQAYDQLIAEGYLLSTPGAPTRVSAAVRVPAPEPTEPEPDRVEFDFRPGEPDLRAFPLEAWRRSLRAALSNIDHRLLGYNDPRGLAGLRAALATYLARVRGVACTAPHVVICTGCAQSISVAGHVLRRQGVGRVAIEAPGHPDIRHILDEAGLETVPVAVDDEGLRVSDLERQKVGAVVVSPAHQNPVGGVLSPHRRQRLLAWARQASGVIVEDDYDAEYRYDRVGVGALQGLAPERVMYVGSASKILAPALRLGWLVAGRAFLEDAVEAKRRLDNGSPAIEQLTLARFLDAGELDRHVRRMRAPYQRRRDALLAAIARHCPRWRVRGAAAGLHLLAESPASVDVERLVKRAAALSVRLYPLSRYTARPSTRAGIVFGYASLSETEIAEGMRRVGRALRA